MKAALTEERVQQHLQVLPLSAGASLGMAAVMGTLLWPAAAPHALLAWLGALLFALGLRLAVGWGQRRSAPAEAGRWLRRHRATFAVHGLAWAALVLVPGDGLGTRELDLMVFALGAMMAGALGAASFDLAAALLFSAPPVVAAVGAAWRAPGPGAAALAAMSLLFLAVALSAARRGHAMARESVRLRLAEAARAGEARDNSQRADVAHLRLAEQHQLMTQLLQTTRQGFWFTDIEGRTTDLNPAMATLLGRPREALLGCSVFDLVSEADRPLMRAQLNARAEGTVAGDELSLQRPDGSTVHCLCNATPLFDTTGAQVGAVGLWTDITARRHAEAVLRTYELAVNSITDIVSVISAHEIYLLVNDAWCQGTGLRREQALGRPSGQVLGPGLSEERRRALAECIATGELRRARGNDVLSGLRDRVVETTYFPHRSASGEVEDVVLVTRDITAQERSRAALEAAEAAQRALLQAFPGCIAAVDEHDVYTHVNARLAALLGCTPEQAVGRPVREVMGEVRWATVGAALQRARAGELQVLEAQYRDPATGLPFIMDASHVAGPRQADGRQTCYAFGIDITARKQAEAALTSARDEAERANRAKSQFLSQMSHELRTPLNAILGFGQLLASDPQATLPAHQQAWLDQLLHGAEHLLSLINEILDLGRIEAGNLVLDTAPLALDGLIDECLGLVQAMAQTRGVRLLPAPAAAQGLQLLADRRRLKQVLLNLLGNAIKYNRAGGTVSLECGREGDALRLAVRDDGPGLTADQQQRLFQPFERLQAARSGVEGTGIGLALSRRLVEAMGGVIGVDSTPGTGSCFWLRLPGLLQGGAGGAAAPAGTAPTALPAPDRPPHTVLYIEDNAVNVVLMEAMLARLPGVRLHSADRPSTGLRLAAELRPALVLLDIHLPEMDGYAVLRHLRAHPVTADTPVIAVSANALQADIDAALAAGFSDYLTKPLTLETLLDNVQRRLPRG